MSFVGSAFAAAITLSRAGIDGAFFPALFEFAMHRR
jgi:hypothetical protein